MSHRIFDGMTIDGHEVDTSRLKDTGKVYVGDEEWDASDLITDEDKLEVFNDGALLTKKDLLKSIDDLLKEIEKDSKTDTAHSGAYYSRYTDLINRFRAKVDKCVFPEKLEDWWYYTYDVMETGVKLSLEHAGSCDLDDEGFPDFIWVDTSFELLHIKAELLTVEQYAQSYGVTTTTVRQWIRRGKIRTAVKQGNEWRIPELAEVRERGYKNVQYHWDEFLTGFPEEYAFINDYNLVSLWQNDERKDLFDVAFSGKGKEERVIQMDQKEREKLELLLISNPFVSPTNARITSR